MFAIKMMINLTIKSKFINLGNILETNFVRSVRFPMMTLSDIDT